MPKQIITVTEEERGIHTNNCATINKYLRRAGLDERLVRGNGYLYFTEGNAFGWYSSSLPFWDPSDMAVGYYIDHVISENKKYVADRIVK
jgi:hypothetical protein